MISLTDYIKQELSHPDHNQIIEMLLSLVDNDEKLYQLNPPFDTYRHGRLRGDIFFPEGIAALDVNSPLMVEVKTGLLMNVYQRELGKGMDYICANKGARYWVVYAYTNLNIPETKIEGVSFISIDSIIKKAGIHTGNEKGTISEKGKEPISSGNAPVKTEIESQEELMKKAAKALDDTRCSFILGAGVSVDAGSPSWDGLLKSLLTDIPQHRPIEDADYDNVNSKCGWSALITARYILGSHLSTKELADKMRSAIYTAEPREYRKTPTALPEIARICKSKKIESILTFNYDMFMEEALDKESVLYKTVFDKGATSAKDLPVYHLHGFISRDSNAPYSSPVLSEREYHRLYSNDFHWSNVELLHALTRNTCFLVGLSMSDPNLRRLLDIARFDDDGQPRHFIFMRREPLGNPADPAKDDQHWNNVEKQFRELGLNIIWFDYNPADNGDFTDLARKLSAI